MPGSVEADPRIGTEIAGYRIERLLGRGGMSVVYLAEHLRLRRKVALKLLAPELAADEGFRERFLRESELAASLDHPNVIPIHDADEADGVLFIAMRYVEGQDLAKRLGEAGRLDPAEALSILGRVADALDAAHRRGLIHRDVKPGNVLLSDEGHVYLADFGLTRRTEDDAPLTESGQFVGTMDYVAPEQIESKGVSAQTDVYALSGVLFECLTGERPFTGDSTIGLLFAHLQNDPPRASERVEELPDAIDPVVARGLAKRPQDRYGSCSELVEEARVPLGLSGEITQPVVSPSPIRRRRLVLGALLVVAIGVVAAILAVVLTGGGDSSGGAAAPTTDLDLFDSPVLQRLDPDTNELVATVPVAFSSGDPFDRPKRTAASAGGVWTISPADGGVQRVNADTSQIVFVGVRGAPAGVAADGEFVWVISELDEEAWLTKIDNATTGRLREISLGTLRPRSVAAGEGSVWVVGQGFGEVFGQKPGLAGGMLVRIDRDTEAATAIPLAAVTQDVAAGEGFAWAVGNLPLDVSVLVLERIDPLNNTVAQVEIELGTENPERAATLATGEGFVWLTGNVDPLLRIDRRTLASEKIELDLDSSGRAPTRVAVGHGSIWVTTDPGRPDTAGAPPATVSRLDPTTGEVLAMVVVGPVADIVTVGEEAVWVEACAQNELVVGRTGCSEQRTID